MTEDDTVRVGQFCDELLAHPLWTTLNVEFEQTTVAQMLHSDPCAQTEREDLYFTYNGYLSFKSFMRNFVKAKNDILNQRDLIALSDQDGLNDIDDANY